MSIESKNEEIILKEIRDMPLEVMPEIISILRSFKKSIKTISTSKQQISKNSGLCGIWKDTRSADEIIDQIYDSRTGFSSQRIEL